MNQRNHCLDYTDLAKNLTKDDPKQQEDMRQLAMAAPALGFILVINLICALDFFGVIHMWN